ncbi:probable serine carboxypeptidase CPVL [Xenopus laevis]|uniref:Probable serine carboxypeptidase CPVL n=1 Tax=Xenopus laevis TaxID=8355 RepID=A0A8J1L387_XENLA|nr:probable serine carboxypeptidase CPVL [Xenopus laevis]
MRILHCNAWKYMPTIGYYIHTHNPTTKLKINFKGIAIGDGLCDPEMVFDALLNGDWTEYPSFYQNATGCTNYFNFPYCQVSIINTYFSPVVLGLFRA